MNYGLKTKCFGALILLFLSATLVVPNTLRNMVLPLFLALPILIIFDTKILFERKIITIFICGTIITIVYLLRGVTNSHQGSFEQVVFVYILSPVAWMILIYYMFLKYTLNTIALIFIYLGIVSALTVPLFIFLFYSKGAGFLTWIIAAPNLEYYKGQTTITMHVFGPLLFIIPGFLSSPDILNNKFIRILTFIIFSAATIASGRTALFLAYILGVIVLSLKYFSVKRITMIFIFFVTISGTIYGLNEVFDLDSILISKRHIEKIVDGGGYARKLQNKVLLNGIYDNYFLGAGHGVGLEMIRNERYPWRYELFWLATLYRVGLIGTIIYSLPFFIVLWCYFKLRILNKSAYAKTDDFMFVGMVSSLIGSYTNPYYESFQFQWMIFLPFIYFLKVNGSLKFNQCDKLK